jgi:hypothetical protein
MNCRGSAEVLTHLLQVGGHRDVLAVPIYMKILRHISNENERKKEATDDI